MTPPISSVLAKPVLTTPSLHVLRPEILQYDSRGFDNYSRSVLGVASAFSIGLVPPLSRRWPQDMNELDLIGEYCRERDRSVLSDPEFVHFSPQSVPALYSDFYEFYNRYLLALNHDIQMLRRYVRSLCAWREVGLSHPEDLEGTVWGCILADFVEPTIRSAIDLPIEIKEKIYQGAWKLTEIAQNGTQGVISIEEREKKRPDKYKLLSSHGVESRELEYLRKCLDALHGKGQAEAFELEELHGEKHHDILPPIHMSYPLVRAERDDSSGMMVVHRTDDKLDWHSLISIIDSQRILAQDAYKAFHSYVQMLIGRGLHIM